MLSCLEWNLGLVHAGKCAAAELQRQSLPSAQVLAIHSRLALNSESCLSSRNLDLISLCLYSKPAPLGIVLPALRPVPVLGNLSQENCSEFKAILSYIVSCPLVQCKVLSQKIKRGAGCGEPCL